MSLSYLVEEYINVIFVPPYTLYYVVYYIYYMTFYCQHYLHLLLTFSRYTLYLLLELNHQSYCIIGLWFGEGPGGGELVISNFLNIHSKFFFKRGIAIEFCSELVFSTAYIFALWRGRVELYDLGGFKM